METRGRGWGLCALGLWAAFAGAARAAEPVALNPWWDRYAHDARLVRLPDGRRLNLYCEGSGSPTVILDAGLGAAAPAWRHVQDALARTTRVCSYDRAGYGPSDPAPGARDTPALAADLEALVKAGRLTGPLVMVGHSMGGPDVRLFTRRNRARVAGMVLVDPSSDHQAQRMDAVSPNFAAITARMQEPIAACLAKAQAGKLEPGTAFYQLCVGFPPSDMPQALAPAYMELEQRVPHLEMILAETRAVSGPDAYAIGGQAGVLGNLPLIVLSAERTGRSYPVPEARWPAAAALWSQMHDEIAAQSTRGVNRQVAGAGHAIQDDQPQAVIDAVNEVVAMARHAR